jgi:hypothetical protein
MNSSRFVLTFFLTLLVTLSIGSALANECASAPMQSENGSYDGCEVIHGAEVLFHNSEEVPESECLKVCEGLSEMDAMAAESHKLDAEAGFGSVDSN